VTGFGNEVFHFTVVLPQYHNVAVLNIKFTDIRIAQCITSLLMY
jgi:hypothetical protein